MNKKNLILVLLIFVFLTIGTIGITSLAHNIYYFEDIMEFETYVMVGDGPGFAVDSERFFFGQIDYKRGGNSTKNFTIENLRKVDVLVNFEQTGDLAEYIKLEPFVLESGEFKDVEVTLRMPAGLEEGDYYGNLKVIVTRA